MTERYNSRKADPRGCRIHRRDINAIGNNRRHGTIDAAIDPKEVVIRRYYILTRGVIGTQYYFVGRSIPELRDGDLQSLGLHIARLVIQRLRGEKISDDYVDGGMACSFFNRVLLLHRTHSF